MASRAFVIAIEDYGEGNYLPSLDGCNRDAEIFIRWLMEKKLKNVKPESLPDFLRCCSGKAFAGGPELEWRTAGTTSVEILRELGQFVKKWAGLTEEFFFFFSGHGFSYANSAWEKSVDVLVASDFDGLETGGRACLPLNEMKTKLWKALGPRHHYYFVDACRNQINSEQISPTGTGFGFANSQLGTPTVYKMFSTAQGKISDTESGFTPLLVKGLSGGGRAKGLRSNRMYVVFDLLCEYMKKGLKPAGQDVDFEREGSGEGYILELDPIENSVCEVSVENASPDDEFTLIVRDIKGLDREHRFSGASFKIPLFPDEYFLELKHASGTVVQKEPPPPDAVDIYDPCAIRFEFKPSSTPAPDSPAAEPAPAQPLTGTLLLKPPPRAEVELENMKTGDAVRGTGVQGLLLSPGEYVVRLRERGVTLSRQGLTLKPGEELTLDLSARSTDKVRETIIKAVGADTAEGASVFSEHALGPLVNEDLALWLSLFGASRILGTPGEFSRLERLPLATFDDVSEGESAVYLLAGFEKSEGAPGVALSSGSQVTWETPREVEGLYRIYERRMAAARGSHLLSLNLPRQPTATFAVHCMPNRATLAAVAEDIEGRLTLHQFMLPMRHLFAKMGPDVQSFAGRNMLGAVRTMALAQTQFARKRSVQNLLRESDPEAWDDLVNHRWLDPLMALVAAYDIFRNGTAEQNQKLLGLMNSGLRAEFEGMGDVEAIAKLIGARWGVPPSPPLLLDGVLAFDDVQEHRMLPLPPEKLDYKSMWTAWRGAVEGPAHGTDAAQGVTDGPNEKQKVDGGLNGKQD
jgi:Caspase domain